jgi:hypothetical protein
MRKTRVWITLSCCLLATAIFASAQTSRKPGLYEVTTTMTWQQSPMPPGMQAPPGSPFSGAPRTTQVCVTQAQIDKYGGPLPQTRGDCQVTGIQMRPTGMSATMACTGSVTGSGSVEAYFLDGEHAKTKVHFSGTMTMGPNSRPIEWTMESNSTFKGADCGSVRPIVTPGN